MAAFPRGGSVRAMLFVPKAHMPCSHQLLRNLLRARAVPLLRYFKTSAMRRATANAVKQPPSSPAGTPSTPTLRPRGPTLAEQLGRKSSPTVLYEAPSHFWFAFSSFGAGAFCITYTVVNYWSLYLHPPPNLAWWVPHAYGLICVFMAGMGTYFMMGPSRVIRSIRAVPLRLGTGREVARAGVASSPIQLEIATRRLIPFMPLRRVLVDPTEVILPFRMAGLLSSIGTEQRPLGGREMVVQKRAEEVRRRKDREYEMDHLMTAPFRHAGRAVVMAYRGVARALTREGFAKVKVKGKEYKLDATGGWALDNGRALDRLANVRPNEMG